MCLRKSHERPLLAHTGHANRPGECLLSEAKRTSVIRLLMSANDP